MLTDEDLTRQLSAGFRDTTDHLSYAGRVPAPRSIPRLAVPIGATVAAAAVLTVAAATTAGDGTAPPASVPSSQAHPQLVTSTITVAGYTFSYRHAADDQLVDDLHAVMDPGPVPDDATPIEAPAPAKAWVGTDPASGDQALWVEAPTRNAGRLFALLSPTWTIQQLTDLFHNGRPQPVPATTH